MKTGMIMTKTAVEQQGIKSSLRCADPHCSLGGSCLC